MQTVKSEDALLEKAKAEEQVYNWVEAAILYEQVAESFLGKNSTEKAAETYRMLGYAYSRAAGTAETAEEYRERHENAINAYRKAVDLFKQTKNKPFTHTYWMIESYYNLALIEDRIGNYMASAEYYEKVQMSYSELFKTLVDEDSIKIIKMFIKMNEGNELLEKAKAYHKIEDHLKAKEFNIKVSKKLKELSSFTAAYGATYYNAWALLEEAEFLSKQESLEEAIKAYERAKMNFQNTINNLKQAPEGKLPINFITTLEKVAKTRIDYCSARIALEQARILGKEGRHLEAAEIFATTASQFMELCEVYKVEREHRELEAIYHLCRAWEHMELAEEHIDPEMYAKAAKQFTIASDIFIKTKNKFLASGNSAYCLALELGCKFDKSYDAETKAQLYPKIKSILRNASTMYEKGGFKGAADWALATSTYFDAAWHLIKADEKLEIIQKREIMGVAARYLKSTSELFRKAGYPNKEKEILVRLERVKKEDDIHISALNSITKPVICTSTVGISAPACPLETSFSPRVEEMLQLIQDRDISEEIVKISEKRKFPLKLIITEVVLSIAVLLLVITQHFLYALGPGEKVCFPLETTCFPIRNLVDPFLWTAIAAQIAVIILIIFVSFKQQIHEILTSLKHHLSRNEENQNKD